MVERRRPGVISTPELVSHRRRGDHHLQQSAATIALWALLLHLALQVATGATAAASLEENEAIQRFREYLRIRTVQPSPDYGGAVEFLYKQAREIGLEASVVELVEGKPIFLMTWEGVDPSLPSVFLSSHMDVVAVDEESWKHDPFGAVVEENGDIYGRGTQDMKGMGMHYLEALRRLKGEGHWRPLRSVHVIFVPDEEIGGDDGWGVFSESSEFKLLNAGVVLDEGTFSTGDGTYQICAAEKSPWWLVIKATGDSGHGSILLDGSAMENLFKSIEAITCFRDAQFDLLKAGAGDGEVVSVNAVYLKAGTTTGEGFTMNIQPAEAEAGFDIRVPPYADVATALERRIKEEWAPSSRNLTYWYEQKFETDDGKPAATATDDSNPWWRVLNSVLMDVANSKLEPVVGSASSDMRFVRKKGISAFGFTTIRDTPNRRHSDNEYVNGWIWLRGIPLLADIIEAYASLPGDADRSDLASHHDSWRETYKSRVSSS